MRFDSDVTFAPVPSAADVFVVGGNSLSTGIRDSAAAVAANDKAGMNASLGALANAISHVADEHAKIGLSGGRLDRIGDSLAVRGITLKDEHSVVEDTDLRSEEHTSELQSLMRISYAVFRLTHNTK